MSDCKDQIYTKKPRDYATCFDYGYMPRGLVLLKTLNAATEGSMLHILAIDNRAYADLKKMGLERAKIYSMDEVMTPELEKAKGNRTFQEFCWTLASYFSNWLLEKGVEEITYLDADLAFFDDPEIVHKEIGGRQIAIIPHRFPPDRMHFEANGKYNVSWVTFSGSYGRTCAKIWRDQCLDWCYYKVEPDRFGDQKYLDAWPGKYG